MKLIKRFYHVIFATLVFISCNTDDNSGPIPAEPLGDYEAGVFITNEGPFGTGTGTVSFIGNDRTVAQNNIFQQVNNEDLGNIVQSMGFSEERAYIVVNNSNKIEVVNRFTFESIETIEDGLNNPRFFASVGTKGYVTNWGDPFDETDDFIAVIDLFSNTVVSSIPVDFGPEKIVNPPFDERIFVLHQGGYSFNNIISIINTNTNTIEATIEVGDVPNSIHGDGFNLWVLCGGKPDYSGDETGGTLYRIDSSNSPFLEFEFEIDEHPSNLVADTVNDPAVFFLLNGNIVQYYGFDFTSFETNTYGGSFYSLGISDNLDILYASDAGDFLSNGKLKIFRSDDALENELDSFSVGIIPGGIYYND